MKFLSRVRVGNILRYVKFSVYSVLMKLNRVCSLHFSANDIHSSNKFKEKNGSSHYLVNASHYSSSYFGLTGYG